MTSTATPARVPDAEPHAVADEPPALDEEADVVTAIGGVFYLVHVLVELDLLGPSEHAAPVVDAIGPWGVFDLVARALVSELGPDDERDPLWALLAALAGRGPEPRFAPAEEAPRARDEHVGLDGAVRSDFVPPAAWIFERGAPFTARGYGLEALPPSLLAWLEGVVPFVRARLDHALEGAPLAPILQRPARIFVTRTHVDVVERAEDASIAARRAGLDRDPGWRPELGRVIQFHFR
ncbi:hypothetical protein L6R52_40205 [Myxococcota bacterium]|nr:hypothetical protein [Myxococcota bacterium]